MTYTVIIRPEAESDLADAYDWYQRQREGLGHEYLLCVEAALEAISRSPLQYATVHGEVRRALVRRFPYGVFYLIEGTTVVVTAVFHCRRDPSGWRDRG